MAATRTKSSSTRSASCRTSASPPSVRTMAATLLRTRRIEVAWRGLGMKVSPRSKMETCPRRRPSASTTGRARMSWRSRSSSASAQVLSSVTVCGSRRMMSSTRGVTSPTKGGSSAPKRPRMASMRSLELPQRAATWSGWPTARLYSA